MSNYAIIDNNSLTRFAEVLANTDEFIEKTEFAKLIKNSFQSYLDTQKDAYGNLVILDTLTRELTKGDPNNPYVIAANLLLVEHPDGSKTFAGHQVYETETLRALQRGDFTDEKDLNDKAILEWLQEPDNANKKTTILSDDNYFYQNGDGVKGSGKQYLDSISNSDPNKPVALPSSLNAKKMLEEGNIHIKEFLEYQTRLQSTNNNQPAQQYLTEKQAYDLAKQNNAKIQFVENDRVWLNLTDEEVARFSSRKEIPNFFTYEELKIHPQLLIDDANKQQSAAYRAFSGDDMTEGEKLQLAKFTGVGKAFLHGLGIIGTAVYFSALSNDVAQALEDGNDEEAYRIMTEETLALAGGDLAHGAVALAGLAAIAAGAAVVSVPGLIGLFAAGAAASYLGEEAARAYGEEIIGGLEQAGLIGAEFKQAVIDKGGYLFQTLDNYIDDITAAAQRGAEDLSAIYDNIIDQLAAFLNHVEYGDNLPETPPSADMAGARGWFLEALLNVQAPRRGDPPVIDLDGDGFPACVNTHHIIFNKPVNNNYKLLRAA